MWKIINSWYVYQIQPQETEDHHLFTEKAVEITRNFPRRFFHIADFPRPSSSIGDLVWAAGSDQRHEGTPTSNDGFFHQTKTSDFLRQKMNLEAKKNEYIPHNEQQKVPEKYGIPKENWQLYSNHPFFGGVRKC